MTDTITIDLPGKFDSFFNGTSVAQENLEIVDTGYLGAPGLRAAYDAAEIINRGRGYLVRLTIPVDEHTGEVLDCLRDYAEVCLIGARDSEDRAEADAAQKVLDRIEFTTRTLAAAK